MEKHRVKKEEVLDTMQERHSEAAEIIREATTEIFEEENKNNKLDFDEIDDALDALLNS